VGRRSPRSHRAGTGFVCAPRERQLRTRYIPRLYWLAGGILTLRVAWAIRTSVGFRLASVAGVVAITAALLVVLREFLTDVVSPVKVINVLGFAALRWEHFVLWVPSRSSDARATDGR